MPITSYTCTQPNIAVFLDQGQCTVNSSRFRMCASKEGARPALLSSSADLGVYAWDSSVPPYPNPLWCWTFPKDGVLGV